MRIASMRSTALTHDILLAVLSSVRTSLKDGSWMSSQVHWHGWHVVLQIGLLIHTRLSGQRKSNDANIDPMMPRTMISGAVSLQEAVLPSKGPQSLHISTLIEFYHVAGLAAIRRFDLGPNKAQDPAWIPSQQRKVEVACYLLQASKKRFGGFRLNAPAKWREISAGGTPEQLFLVRSLHALNRK